MVDLLKLEGGFPVGSDGRVHTTFTHNPSSLRLSSVDPNLQNLPRGVDSEIEHWVKEIFVAPEGSKFWARDFSGIEAVLVGYFAGSPRYTRLAKLGVHDFLTAHLIEGGDLPDLAWSDADLRAFFKDIKKRFKSLRDKAKRTVHASNYMTTPSKLVFEYPEVFPNVKEASRLQGIYFDLFPEIREWHKDLCIRVDGTKRREIADQTGLLPERVDPWTLGVCHVFNPFGYCHRFYNVLDWEKVEVARGSYEWLWSYGEDAKRLISFLPQSTAAAIIKQKTKVLWNEYPWVGETMRLLIHDEVFGEAKDKMIDVCLDVSEKVMESPIMELPLDPTWGMGEYLSIGTEGKVGQTWATMQ